MKKTNFCFEANTPFIYKKEENGPIIIESFKDAYDKLEENETIFVCGFNIDPFENESKMTWREATMCKTKTNKIVEIFFIPNELASSLECDNIVRVTPNHIFPVLTKQGLKDKEAYLLETGDKILFEKTRVFGDDEIPMLEEDGEIKIESILEDHSLHSIEYRSIAKIYQNDTTVIETCYGVVLKDSTETDSKYFMICNSLISHDSTVDY